MPLLAERLDTAKSVDLAIAFAMDSGVALLEPWFREMLARGGRLRIVVGDYLETTDPTALARLLDLEGAELFVFETGGLSFHPKAWLFRAADARGGSDCRKLEPFAVGADRGGRVESAFRRCR